MSCFRPGSCTTGLIVQKGAAGGIIGKAGGNLRLIVTLCVTKLNHFIYFLLCFSESKRAAVSRWKSKKIFWVGVWWLFLIPTLLSTLPKPSTASFAQKGSFKTLEKKGSKIDSRFASPTDKPTAPPSGMDGQSSNTTHLLKETKETSCTPTFLWQLISAFFVLVPGQLLAAYNSLPPSSRPVMSNNMPFSPYGVADMSSMCYVHNKKRGQRNLQPSQTSPGMFECRPEDPCKGSINVSPQVSYNPGMFSDPSGIVVVCVCFFLFLFFFFISSMFSGVDEYEYLRSDARPSNACPLQPLRPRPHYLHRAQQEARCKQLARLEDSPWGVRVSPHRPVQRSYHTLWSA